MEIRLPDDCDNAPRIGILNEFLVHWTGGRHIDVADRMATDVRWSMAGGIAEGTA
ncbi:hypothetical protein ACFFIO_06010 [Citricoccus parietis]|uniref:Uncharacterized protein n=1 Tax=Citricoccus parietis TaxID=592307 RepID=A0ABV6F401_9MICC